MSVFKCQHKLPVEINWVPTVNLVCNECRDRMVAETLINVKSDGVIALTALGSLYRDRGK